MPDQEAPIPRVPESRAVPRSRTRLSVVWIIPILAAVVGAWVAVTKILSEGPTITIVFDSAEGLEAGKTKIHFNGVEVGRLTTIRLSDDHERVITTAQMAPKTEDYFVEDTRFWVVRPRVSGSSVSGLGTLLSGAYIGMEIGTSKASKRDFVALANPPVISEDVPGRFFVLKTPDLGSLDTGTPIFFRRLTVGQVAAYELDKDGRALTVRVFVNAPYDQYVSANTRFWQASGIDVSLSASGLSVQTQSVVSMLVGGIAFETPSTGPVLPPAEPDTVFELYGDRADAFKPAARDPQTYELLFLDSVRGLTAGAPVEFRGIQVGEVVDVSARVDAKTLDFSAPVVIRLDPIRLGVNVADLAPGQDFASVRKQLLEGLVARGARAQLRSGNLLTGALYVAFDFFPNAPPATLDWSQHPVKLPTMPGQLEAIEDSVARIIKKIDKLPLQDIANDLRKSIVALDATLVSARRTVDDAGKLIEPSSPLSAELGSTLEEVSRAARGLRLLMDYLERHPEALIRGKSGEAQ